MDDDEIRDPQLLVLIEQSHDAQRLIVTWRKASVDYGELLTDSPKRLTAADPFTVEWSRVSGVDVDDVARLAPVLFENGLLFEEGGVHDTVDAYVRKRGRSIVGARG